MTSISRAAAERAAAEVVTARVLGVAVRGVTVTGGRVHCDRDTGDAQTEALIAAAGSLRAGEPVADARVAALARVVVEDQRALVRVMATVLARHGHLGVTEIEELRG